MRAANIWQWEGRVERATYATVGAVAFAVKFSIDWLIVTRLFHRSWSLLNYWRPFGAISGVHALSFENRVFASVMLFMAVPFIWLGLAMTVKRLRDAGEPTWIAALFFVPVVNLLFFLALSVKPSARETRSDEGAPWPGPRFLDGWIPETRAGSALASIAITAAMGLGFTLLGTQVVATYGWGLFVGLPFCLGLFAVLMHSYREPRSYSECVLMAVLPVLFLGTVLLLLAIEGLICILMAAPIAVVMALLGGSLGFVIQAAHWGRRNAQAIFSLVVLLTPGFYGAEHFTRPQAGVFEVKSAIEMNAPPEKVWQKVVAFAEIPAPKEMLFRAGIAYPIRAEITGRGPGAVRHCVFSTGPFVEPITVWDEPRLLRFNVTANPAPLTELTPYGHIEPRHLHGYFESHQGQFLLTELPDGRTRVEGTTWYSHSMWPETYWHRWSDYMIQRIHMRVFEHIRVEAER
ncbi:MAG TPA: DUF805 domain-containing protein [Candidatus Bathyarchaeia archaeon]|nr:DUF805 domain-containing protein [Candidatus Bathyarchaeia archaeon]